jgi:hypothetical protein
MALLGTGTPWQDDGDDTSVRGEKARASSSVRVKERENGVITGLGRKDKMGKWALQRSYCWAKSYSGFKVWHCRTLSAGLPHSPNSRDLATKYMTLSA